MKSLDELINHMRIVSVAVSNNQIDEYAVFDKDEFLNLAEAIDKQYQASIKATNLVRTEEYIELPKDYDGVPMPMPTTDGLFVVEHQDGTAQKVQPNSLTFLGSKELFDQCDWSE